MDNFSPLLHPHTYALFSPEDTYRLFLLGKKQVFNKDEFIFHATGEKRYIHILLKGQAKIFHASSNGKDVILWFCLPGEICGLAECFNDASRKVFAQACSQTTVLSISEMEFRKFLTSCPNSAIKLIELLSQRMRILSNTVLSLATEDVEARIKQIIVRLSKCYGVNNGSTTKVDFSITHQEIADMIGASRQTVTTVINQLKKQNLISTKQHKFHINHKHWPEFIVSNKTTSAPFLSAV